MIVTCGKAIHIALNLLNSIFRACAEKENKLIKEKRNTIPFMKTPWQKQSSNGFTTQGMSVKLRFSGNNKKGHR
tara:strand:+ start:749 stop:970 length:222 start_codon:yes stop_codon:yes gene_type:complete